ncbi:MAG TPA: hypothetical protein VMT81_00610 [Candidatus Paceibacterota bacterium]|nr:hypothetical protein [Candidatus Paceibacterota bacterium]
MSETKRKILIIVVLLLVVLFGVGQFFAFSGPGAANNPGNQTAEPPTEVVAYTPPLLASSTPVENGSCWTNSIAAPYRPDAWRCMVGNAISDPCFMLPGSSTTLACGLDPAVTDESSAFVLRLTKPLPKPETPSSTPSNWAWMVALVDGTTCTPFTGTRPFTASGDIAYYGCSGGTVPTGTLIFGELDNTSSSGIWTAELGVLSTATSTFPPAIVASATVPVATVWQ